MDFSQRLRNALEIARQQLLSARVPAGHWVGELSSSALSTATAVTALAVVERECADASRVTHHASRITRGLDWLARNVNPDGGWGDTTVSLSNLSTIALCWAAFGIVPGADETYASVVKGAERWLIQRAGGVTPDKLARAIIQRYGKDRTFSAPILTMCALSGRLGQGPEAWRWVLPLPFELAALPPRFFAALRLPVVSYALPALIAIGQARHCQRPSQNPLARFTRRLARDRTLKVLTEIQPSSGGFLEATPLTSFVVMSLAGSGQVNHPVTKKGVEFLIASARDDGSWPIDTNLATWVTTLSVNALSAGSTPASPAASGARQEAWSIPGLGRDESLSLARLLLEQQQRDVHPYTNAAPGGWAWTDLPGGVPDADDTAGTLLALHSLAWWQRPAGRPAKELSAGGATPAVDERTLDAVIAGVNWLINLQNSDGGIPTFCRGWTNLPFDRSSADLTAHALRAWSVWLPDLPLELQRRAQRAIERGVRYLARSQREHGAWSPLWFGNQHLADNENPVYGTARVVVALADIVGQVSRPPPPKSTHGAKNLQAASGRNSNDLWTGKIPGILSDLLARGVGWLLEAQKREGSWGAPSNGPASVEETALALEALAALAGLDSVGLASCRTLDVCQVREAAMKGANWLLEKVETGGWLEPSPIGFYFAKLWYYERLYPQIFTVAALSRLARVFNMQPASPQE